MNDDIKAVRGWLSAGIVPPEYEETWSSILDGYEAMEKALEFYAGCKSLADIGINDLETLPNGFNKRIGRHARETLAKIRGGK